MASKKFRIDDNRDVGDSGGRMNEIFENLSKNKKLKNSAYIPNIATIEKLIFLIFDAKKVFNQL